jgi:uncharacterized protein
MAQDLYRYDKMVENALRGVVREALSRAAREGLRGGHHFYIGFVTGAPGVVLPESLVEQYPDEMTIVLQHQFWDLEVRPESFSVTLSFQRRPERLTIPFAAIRSFTDPSVEFGLQFNVAAAAKATRTEALPAPAAAAAETIERGAAEIVTLDKFRKR